MDIHNKTKEQLIAELLNLQEQNSKLKSQLDSITYLKNTEELLLNSELENKNKFATLNSIFESTQNIIIFSLDTNYCYTAFTNLHKKTMKLIWGVDIALGMNMLELIQLPADRKKAKDNFDKVLSGEYLRFEEEYGDINLFRTYYEDTYNPIIDNNGNVVGLSVFVVDITERKQAEQALKESEEKYRLITEFTADVVWVFNITTRKFTYISPSVYQLRGFTSEEAINQTLEDSIASNSIGIVKDTIAKYISNFIEHPESPNYYINEIQQYCKNGDVIWVEISSQYRYNPSGEIEVVGVSRNIEIRKNAELELKYSE